MENQRIFLFLALSILGLLLWTSWERDTRAPVATEEVVEADEDIPAPADTPDEAPDRPDAETPARERAEVEDERRVRVVTDRLDLDISTRGGDIRRVDLLQHGTTADDDTPFRLMADDRDPLFIAQTGLIDGSDNRPDHRALFRAEREEYRLEEGDEEIEVRLTWADEERGIEVARVYTFHRDSYLIDVRHQVRNAGQEEWRGYSYFQLRRNPDPPGTTPWYIYTFTGASFYSPEDRFEKLSFDDMDDADLSRDIRDGWAAMIQHYFLGAWIPPESQALRYFTQAQAGNEYVLGMSSGRQTLAPGEETEFVNRLFVGPKEQERLRELHDSLTLSVDYGFLTVLAKPLFWLLDNIQNFVGNWGVAIILVTLLIKLAFYKLSATSYRSMAKMRRVQPRMQQLKERHGDDKQALNQAMMELYKKEKINPLGGCLPILVQIPVFIALYWVLLESVELRHAPFMLWIQDLSSRDPYFVLPLLMGATMFLQQKLNPAPLDPIQQRIMMALPIVFTGFFMLFPAGLVLYWLVNNGLSIAQQWYIMRNLETEESGKTGKGGKKQD